MPEVITGPNHMAVILAMTEAGAEDVSIYHMGGVTIMAAREPYDDDARPSALTRPAPDSTLLWHLSISHRKRYPTWDEIMQARTHCLPADRAFAQLFPSSFEEFVNIHDNCFHLWEIQGQQ